MRRDRRNRPIQGGRRWIAAAGALILAVGLAGCGTGADEPSASKEEEPAKAEDAPQPDLASARAGDLKASGGWAVEPAAPDTTAAYLTVTNTGSSGDALVKADSEAAKTVMFHETKKSGSGAEKMVGVTSFDLPAGGEVTFEPGGAHLMVMGLDAELKPGDSLPITLTSRAGTTLRLDLPVLSRTERPGQ